MYLCDIKKVSHRRSFRVQVSTNHYWLGATTIDTQPQHIFKYYMHKSFVADHKNHEIYV